MKKIANIIETVIFYHFMYHKDSDYFLTVAKIVK